MSAQNKNAIAVFAKTPALSPVKTRLAATVSTVKAQEIYKLCVQSMQEVLSEFQSQNKDWNICWVLGEEAGPAHDFWQNRPFQKMWTGDGELGTRLHNVQRTLMKKHKTVMMMSTDSPQLSSSDLQNAVDTISDSNCVIGPAHDGGYYLFGSNFKINKEIWDAVPYSQNNTREKFLEQLSQDVPTLKYKSDLDTIDDIQIIIDEMPNHKTAAQSKLCKELKSLIS